VIRLRGAYAPLSLAVAANAIKRGKNFFAVYF
jgi:hypothetical protein